MVFKTLRIKLIILMALLMIVSLAATQIVGVVETKKMIRQDVEKRAQSILNGVLGDIRDSF